MKATKEEILKIVEELLSRSSEEIELEVVVGYKVDSQLLSQWSNIEIRRMIR